MTEQQLKEIEDSVVDLADHTFAGTYRELIAEVRRLQPKGPWRSVHTVRQENQALRELLRETLPYLPKQALRELLREALPYLPEAISIAERIDAALGEK